MHQVLDRHAAASRRQQREIVHIWILCQTHCCRNLWAVWIPSLFQAPAPTSRSCSHKHVSRVYFELITDNLHRISWWTPMSEAARHPTPLQTFVRMRMAFTSAPMGIMGYTKRCWRLESDLNCILVGLKRRWNEVGCVPVNILQSSCIFNPFYAKYFFPLEISWVPIFSFIPFV